MNLAHTLFLAALLCSCTSTPTEGVPDVPKNTERSVKPQELVDGLPTVGVLMYDKVLGTEVTAPIDVFSKHTEDGKQLFNVVTIAESAEPVASEEGLRMVPDRTFATAPDLDVLVVPSAYDMSSLVKNEALIRFIQDQDRHTDFTMSNCAGAHLVGEAGIAEGKKVVTWIGGGTELQEKYPALKVQDDSKVTFVRDGKLFSSNGNLASYVSSLELLEEMTTEEHRAFVESYLYLGRLQAWKRPTSETEPVP